MRMNTQASSTAGAVFGAVVALCACVLLIGGTVKVLTIWF